MLDDHDLTTLICFDARDAKGATNRIELEVNKRMTRGVISCVVYRNKQTINFIERENQLTMVLIRCESF